MDSDDKPEPDTAALVLRGLVLGVGAVLGLGLTAGYVMNAIKVVTALNESGFLQFARGLGLMLPPLGAVLGWF